MPVNIIIIEKSGSIKELEVKTYNENELYKKAGFKTEKDFKLQTVWNADLQGSQFSLEVYAKTTGRAGQENKYEFPPPIDTALFFGSCVIVKKKNGEPDNLTKAQWKTAYEFLYGGFEDIGSEDSSDDEEDSMDEAVPRTKDGYVKDGFVVEDHDSEFDDETESSEEEVKPKPKKQTKKEVAKEIKTTVKKEKKTVFENILKEAETTNYLECSDELMEEKYI